MKIQKQFNDLWIVTIIPTSTDETTQSPSSGRNNRLSSVRPSRKRLRIKQLKLIKRFNFLKIIKRFINYFNVCFDLNSKWIKHPLLFTLDGGQWNSAEATRLVERGHVTTSDLTDYGAKGRVTGPIFRMKIDMSHILQSVASNLAPDDRLIVQKMFQLTWNFGKKKILKKKILKKKNLKKKKKIVNLEKKNFEENNFKKNFFGRIQLKISWLLTMFQTLKTATNEHQEKS